ncbi:PREDICTED: somatostatin-like [Chinchilla lanigera]|uniref:somatostatin-like n=1 Tax=Chinchilla lanigera TaxID=34839 RepID=UPI00038EDA8F|nr:PREDICTED: somatostatin-like [Chinchilla lanigera]
MLSCHLRCVLAVLSIALALDGVTGAFSEDGHSWFVRMYKASSANYRISQFLQKYLLAPEGKRKEVLDTFSAGLPCKNQKKSSVLEPEGLSQASEHNEMRLELQKSVKSNPATAPPKRKKDCKNFYWKSLRPC